MVSDGQKEDNNEKKTLISTNLRPGSGELIIRDNVIRFENVPLVTPNGDVLIQSLNLEVGRLKCYILAH